MPTTPEQPTPTPGPAPTPAPAPAPASTPAPSTAGNLDLYPSAVELFYEESKAARDVMDQLLIRFRTNTTAVIAVATGAATFFGFSQNPKGGWYIASLVSYGIAAVIAAAIYWPKPWKVNVAHDVEKALSTPPATTVTKLRWDLARGHQTAVTESLALVEGRTGQATKFRVLVIATAAVVICAGLNSLLTPKPAIPATHIVFDNPTHVISDNPAHVVLDDPAHVVLDPTHVDTDPIHITIDPSGAVVDPAHIDIGKKDGK